MRIFPFLACEEEKPVLLLVPFFRNEDRASKGVAEVVESKRIHLTGKKRASIELIVADKLERAAVKLLCPALSDHVNECTGAAPELRAVAGSQNLDFGNRVRA